MSILRAFLRHSFKNTAEFRKLRLRQRMMKIHMIDTELERGFCMLRQYTKYGAFWYNCITNPERLWWVGEKEVENNAE